MIFEQRYHYEKWSRADLLRGPGMSWNWRTWCWLNSAAHSSLYLSGILLPHFNSHSSLKSPLRCRSHFLWFVFKVAHRSFVFRADSNLNPHTDSGGCRYPAKARKKSSYLLWGMKSPLLKSYKTISCMYTQTLQMMKGALRKQIDCSALITPKTLQDRAQMWHWKWCGKSPYLIPWIWENIHNFCVTKVPVFWWSGLFMLKFQFQFRHFPKCF